MRTLITICFTACWGLFPRFSFSQSTYTLANLGKPAGAYQAVGVRMNNHGHVAGWSQFWGGPPPILRAWVWTPEGGFTMLPPPSGFSGFRAMDINNSGVLAGDGGYDSGLAWRFENGEYEVFGSVNNMPIAFLGGINNAGDVAGTSMDSRLSTPDYAFLNIRDGQQMTLTPNGGRATDVNNVFQVCGYTQGPFTPFHAFRWEAENGVQLLGNLGLTYSFAVAMNDAGDVVGYAKSGSGNTTKSWIYTDEWGQVELPAPFNNLASSAVHINNHRHVVGVTEISGPDLVWLWTGGDSVTLIRDLYDFAGANMNLLAVMDINDAGQILAQVFDNNVADYRMVLLTPVGAPLIGDVDGDGDVDLVDHQSFADCLTGPAGGIDPGCELADLDADGDVDLVDFMDIQEGFSGS